MSDLNYSEVLIKLFDKLKNNSKHRYFIALSGPPASGKSTISEKLVKDLTFKGYNSSILQMDGYHYDNQILKQKSLLLKKGAPETFDVMGFLNFLSRLQNEDEVAIPIFDRSLELSRSSAVIISKEIRVIIVEGNYLLLKKKPWEKLRNFFDYTISIKCSLKALEKRLIDRWKSFGIDDEIVNKKVFENDLPNGQFVLDLYLIHISEPTRRYAI
mgnify:CR=1 FL=1